MLKFTGFKGRKIKVLTKDQYIIHVVLFGMIKTDIKGTGHILVFCQRPVLSPFVSQYSAYINKDVNILTQLVLKIAREWQKNTLVVHVLSNA